ncbi:Pentatricopeptide repeat-containing protein At4g13650 [Linum perenne]
MSFCRFPTLSKAWKLAAGHLISRAPATACSVENPGCLSDPYFINKAVSFCAKSCSAAGIQFHSPVIKLGFTSNVYVSSAVVDMYAKYGDIWSAHKLFDELPERNTVTWNSLISGYLDADSPKLAVRLFVEMLREEATSVTPFTLSSCLVGCSQLEDRELGEQIHGVSLKSGFGYHVVVGTVLIDMYSKSCSIGESKLVFDRMVGKNVITWTSMVTAYSQNHRPYEAMVLAREMMECGLRLNSVTYNSLLSSFSSPDYLDCCKQVHCRVIREGFESNRYIAVTLVAVYSKCCNRVEEFVKLCSNVTIWDQVSWNALISGYCNLEREKEALRCFCEMRRVGIDGDFYTFTSLLGAIGNSSFLEEGREIHALVSKTGYASSLCIQNGVVSMYARCGSIEESKRMFRMMPEHDVVSWNSLMTACAHHGYGEEAVELFEEMMKKKSVMMINPDATTFLAVLSACSHAGFVDKGLKYFDLLKKNGSSLGAPRLEHYASVVDIFGRAGYLKEAAEFIRNMPVKPGPSVYKALLSACLVHGDLETAELSARKLLDLSPDDSAAYVMLFNMLKRSDHWNDAEALQRLICYRGLKKMPGYSWF